MKKNAGNAIKWIWGSADAAVIALFAFAALRLFHVDLAASWLTAMVLSAAWSMTAGLESGMDLAKEPPSRKRLGLYHAVFIPVSTLLMYLYSRKRRRHEIIAALAGILVNVYAKFRWRKKEGGTSPIFRIVKFLVWVFYPEIRVEGSENLPDEACILVGNHSKMNGPISCELYLPKEHYTWCVGQMMELREVPAYSYADFWSGKPKYIRWFFRLLSFLIAPLSVSVFNNANTIAVHRDNRIAMTFRKTLEKLQEGANIVIFPEHNVPYNEILCAFQDRFIDIAKLYYRRTGKELSFVPMYIAPELRKVFLGKPVRFRHEAQLKEERERICSYVMEDITRRAASLPRHRVVPYRNIPKREYPFSDSVDIREPGEERQRQIGGI